MNTSPRVAIFVDMLGGYGRAVLAGIASYVRTHKPWTISGNPERAVAPIRDLRHWDGDGIIAQAYTPGMAALLREITIPTVNVSQRLPRSEVPSVLCDDDAVGRMGAKYLVDRGFRNFGFAGFAGHRYSVQRAAGFVAELREAGFVCHAYESSPVEMARGRWRSELQRLGQWISGLPKPTAVMCCNDVRARHVAQVCLDNSLRVPEEIALLGADNDELICEMSNPPLSSVDLRVKTIGYAAAELLDAMMNGAAKPTTPTLIPPAGIVTRVSSDVLAIDDTDVAAALRFIRENAFRTITIDEVVAATGSGRRQLERRFARSLNRTIGAQVTLAHIERARQLLIDTDLNTTEVASRCGYRYLQQFNEMFRRHTGFTPARFRKRYRMG